MVPLRAPDGRFSLSAQGLKVVFQFRISTFTGCAGPAIAEIDSPTEWPCSLGAEAIEDPRHEPREVDTHLPPYL